ncbi:BCS1 N terminal-domain-containing protein [Aspergillus multicolor]|uniref:BCS1 and AAA domain-containing protein n=1 Tax=Aspergillus multicolor TaxID=41759 RepID=UPI003CCCF545
MASLSASTMANTDTNTTPSTSIPLTMHANPLLNPSDTALLETFIPGYSMASRFLSTYLQIDLSSYIPYLILLAVMGATIRYIYNQLSALFEEHCISTAEIRHDDEVYNYLMYWLAQQPFTNRTTHFVAGTRISGSARYYDSDDDSEDGWGDADEIDEEGNVIGTEAEDFDAYWAKATARDKHKKLRFTPSEGTHYFWFHGRPLAFIREKQDDKNSGGGYYGYGAKAPERLYVSCIGRDPAVLKELLLEAQRCYVAKDSNNTVIYRGHKAGAYTEWSRCMARAPRALSTVVLDKAQKDAFIDDIKEYLHPRTRRWYSNRGIPYRRGYLLHGPSGTGKTSLCFAAAGLLGLELYLLNLSSKSLDEDELMALFSELPRRCIVLLEDVDCAGMSQKRTAGSSSNDDNSTPASTEQTDGENVNNSGSGSGTGTTSLEKQGVSLSGLLNVIDGVAASEGRILVMTTNHPEKLDPALVRSGRIDMSITFGYSTISDIQELFSAIYSTLEGDLRVSRTERLSPKMRAKMAKRAARLEAQGEKARSNVRVQRMPKYSEEQVSAWAGRFAERVPAGELTPAEIQGYLLNYKTDPEAAIEGAEKWAVEMREKKVKAKNAAVDAAKGNEDKKMEDEKKPEDGDEGTALTNGITHTDTNSNGTVSGD